MSGSAARLEHIEAVAIGASAGGVDALGALLPFLPAGLRAAVFVVVHQPRTRPSLLAGVLAGKCVLPLREAEDKEPALPGIVYIAPPDYHMLLDEGPQLALSADELVNFSRPSIDVLFESAAELYARRLLGIVLTGANADGAAGLAAVHRAGGLAAVQDPQTAEAPLMPASALQRTPAAHSLTLAAMGELLRTLRSR